MFIQNNMQVILMYVSNKMLHSQYNESNDSNKVYFAGLNNQLASA